MRARVCVRGHPLLSIVLKHHLITSEHQMYTTPMTSLGRRDAGVHGDEVDDDPTLSNNHL